MNQRLNEFLCVFRLCFFLFLEKGNSSSENIFVLCLRRLRLVSIEQYEKRFHSAHIFFRIWTV